MKNDLDKKDLYESVKLLAESDAAHIHLPQQKLFTLFSIAFQYILFMSTKKAGAYIIRVEDSHLVDKLARKSKDQTTRRFIQSLLLPRKFKYGKSTFYLDFFHVGSWNLTNMIEKEKLQGALIVRNASSRPMEPMTEGEEQGELSDEELLIASLPKDYYLSSLIDIVPKTITIAYDQSFEQLEEINFPFIKKNKEKTISGVTIGSDVDWDNLDDQPS